MLISCYVYAAGYACKAVGKMDTVVLYLKVLQLAKAKLGWY